MRNIYVAGDEIGRVPLKPKNHAMSYLIDCKKMSTYGDLLKVPAWELRSYFKNWYDYTSVRDDVHSRNYSLLGENLMLGLSFDREESEKLADTKLEDLYFPVPIRNVFTTGCNRAHPIVTVGDLLVVPYEEISEMRGMGVAKLNQINEFVRKLGTFFYDDFVPYSDMPEILREHGIMPIEDLDVVPETKKLLHANGVHSVGDALRNHDKIASFEGFGYQRLMSLYDPLAEMAYFDEVKKSINQNSIDVVREALVPSYPIRCATKDKIQNQSELDQAIVERDELVRRLDYVNARINFLSSPLTNHGKENIQYVKTSE